MTVNMTQIKEAREASGIESWGKNFFGINDQGEVICHPLAKEELSISLPSLVKEAKAKNFATPMILRFPQIIRTQLDKMHNAFRESIWEYSYKGGHLGVFPFKVNQRREFIDSIVQCGKDYNWGLEVGSKTEFMAAMSYPLPKGALLICNGFKDSEFVEMAFISVSMGFKTILVAEGPDELQLIIDKLKDPENTYTSCPEIGLRVRLYSKGSGKWEKSSGETSKFGLTTVELLHALSLIKKEGLEGKLTMLHFHIGSQITSIKRFKNALKEAARVYTKVYKMGMKPEHLNIGGGVGVDYDGSKTSAQSSANYSMQEFANDAVYVVGSICDKEEVPHPNIVTESGRVIAAYHSVIVADIREVQGDETLEEMNPELITTIKNTHKSIKELDYILAHINKKNYSEYYHDAVEYHEELFLLFNLGYVSLIERALAEDLFHKVCRKALYYSSFEKRQSDDFEALQKLKVSKYLANFSIFQSIPDSWSIGQLFPVLPLSRHGEKPSHKATIVDITCDSDGCIDRFIDSKEDKEALNLHTTRKEEPYWLGFFLTGAYQESLANEHNLFGAINEVEATIDPETGKWKIDKLTHGDPIEELLACRNYTSKEMIHSYKTALNKMVQNESLTKAQSEEVFKRLNGFLKASPYLVTT